MFHSRTINYELINYWGFGGSVELSPQPPLILYFFDFLYWFLHLAEQCFRFLETKRFLKLTRFLIPFIIH